MSLPLADELFLITRDLHTGRPRLGEPALGVGLSAALLAELVFSGALVVSEGRVTEGERPPHDALTVLLLEETRKQLAEGEVRVEEWLAARRQGAADLVAERMIEAGELHRQETRRFGRTSVRFLPTESVDAFLRAQRLGAYVRTRSAMSAADVTLTALVEGIDPDGVLLTLDDADHTYLAQMVQQLPPPLPELLVLTEELVRTARRNPYL